MKALILITVAASLTGCVTAGSRATQLDATTIHKICDNFTQLSYDGKLDTGVTKSEIKTFNRKIAAFCRR